MRPDDEHEGVPIVELDDAGVPVAAEPDTAERAARPRPGRRAVAAAGVVAVLVVGALLALLVRHEPNTGRPIRALPASVLGDPSLAFRTPPGGFACDKTTGCALSPGTAPTAGVRAALRAHLPTLTGITAQVYVQPGTSDVRSQFVSAQTPAGLNLTISISYDGDKYSTVPVSRAQDQPPELIFRRHAVEGWSVEVTLGGRLDARTVQSLGLSLVADRRLLS